ncbi:hypothetical protein KAR91_65965 [Candidatus Pacearchaeota archaeon]|nr:hypothetical protein [Candidatus Pacearchaeota archaeon]
MEQELTEMVESIFDRIERNKYYSALGFFQGYSTVEADSSGKRFCRVKLHNKDNNAADISIEDVPVGYPGTKRTSFQDDLLQGDEMLLFFTDRTLEEWKDSGAVGPQITKNTVRNQRSNAFAMPLSTHHNIEDLELPVNDYAKIPLASGKKLQIGYLKGGVKVELLHILYQVIEIAIQDPDMSGKSSAVGETLPSLLALLAQITETTTT